MTSSPPAIEIRGLTQRFGEHVAVDSVDLTVATGECFGLLGPNGAGKTTTIRLLVTLLPVQTGQVSVFGLDVAPEGHGGAPAARLRAPAAVDRGRAHRPGERDVVRPALRHPAPRAGRPGRRGAGHDGPHRRRRADGRQLLRRHGPPAGAGPGAGQPAARCWCSTSRPSASTRWPATACGRGSRDCAADNMTVLLTTHYMEEADALCDRVALMHHGRLRAVGAPDELKAALGPDGHASRTSSATTPAASSRPGEGRPPRSRRSTRRTAGRMG